MDKLNIEEGTDTLDPESNFSPITKPLAICDKHSHKKNSEDVSLRQQRRFSRSVGSYSDEECSKLSKPIFELGSEPLLNIPTTEGNHLYENVLIENSQKEIIKKWLEDTPCSSSENICPSDVSSSASPKHNNPLTARTDALLTRKTFNLVKPKP